MILKRNSSKPAKASGSRPRRWGRAMLLTLALPPLVIGALGLSLAYRIYAANRAASAEERCASMAAPKSSDRLLVFAPHCDDEALGAAGLMRQARAAKATVHVVIITNGSQPTILAKRGEKQQYVHETPKINPADIVDTNGAGDAFAGGVLGALVLGKNIDDAINVGHKLGGMCIGQVGPILKFPKENVL